MDILFTIVPIFVVIGIGWLFRWRGFIPSEFLGPANRLVYHLAIPAMIFRAISKGALKTDFNPAVLGVTLTAILLFFGLIWTAVRLAHMQRRQVGTFLQSAFHGNLGYIGLAVAYYFLGDQGLAGASILAGFMMVLQNLLAVFILQFYGDNPSRGHRTREVMMRILANPVILSAVAGMGFSALAVPLPDTIGRSLDILSNMALPLALLLIGASLSFELMRSRMVSALSSSVLKLMVLPGLGFAMYQFWDIPARNYLPGLILLASPTATIAYVMAKEMKGDTEFAVAAISTSTLLSAVTFFGWLTLNR